MILSVITASVIFAVVAGHADTNDASQSQQRHLLQSGWDSREFSIGGTNVATTLPLASSVGGQGPFSSSSTSSSSTDDSSTRSTSMQSLGGGSFGNRAGPTADADYSWPAGSGTLTDQISYNARDNPYIAQYQSQQGMRLVAQATAEQQQQMRQGGSMSGQASRVANAALRYRMATRGMAGLGPIVTPQMAAALGGGDDDPTVLSERLYRGPAQKAGAGTQASAGAPGAAPKAKSSRSGPAQGYLDEYDYQITPLTYTASAGSSTSRGLHNLDLLQYIQDNSPFAGLADQSSPDLPNLADLVGELRTRMQQDKAAGQKHGLGKQSASLLQQLLRSGYGDAANSVDASAQATDEGIGDVVGSPAGRGYGYGDYYEEDYEGSQSTGVLKSYMRSGVPPGVGAGGPGGRRNLSVGEIAPFCQPPILLCADRDLLNILGTEIDQVRFPDNVLEYTALRRRLERVVDNLIDTNFSPIGGPTFDFNQVLALNFRLRTTLTFLNGLNGIGSNRLALNTLSWDASRPDRLLPESFSWGTGSLTSDNSFNRVNYVPTYIVTGTGPGFASTGIAFGPFVDFQVADFRS